MKSSAAGLAAESAVAHQLQKDGFKILGQNWKTAVCEIDIIAQKDEVTYFVEVKYRSNPDFGAGLDYIGPQKLKKLHFAARIWCQHHNYEGDYRLVGAEVTGANFERVNIIEIF